MPLIVGGVLFVLISAFFILQVRSQGKLSRQHANIMLAALPLLLVLLLWWSVAGIQFLNHFKGLQARDVRSIAFFDPVRNHYRCDRSDPAALATCLEREVTDPATIGALVASFRHLHMYFRNHEGPGDHYLVRVDMTSGTSIWFILGRGTKSDPHTAWVEFDSHITGAWTEVFSNTELYRVLTERVPLHKWPESRRTESPEAASSTKRSVNGASSP